MPDKNNNNNNNNNICKNKNKDKDKNIPQCRKSKYFLTVQWYFVVSSVQIQFQS